MSTRQAKGGVLIVGGGFAGATLAREIGSDGATIVSPDNFMLYTPMLPEVAAGKLSPRDITAPLRVMCPHAEVVLGRATTLDEETGILQVSTEDGDLELGYEHLVIAVGAVSRVLPIPGLAEHGLGFKSLSDATHLRNHVLRQLEQADTLDDPDRAKSHLTFVFVGGGYAGVEAIAELADLVADGIRNYSNLKDAETRWLLVEAEPNILPDIPRRLGDYAAEQLEQRSIEIRTSAQLEAVEEEAVVLSGGERIPCRTLVWTAGVTPSPLVGKLGLPVDDRGRLRVDRYLHVEDRENIWALGDCARVPNEATDSPDPPTSQHALRQARRLAKNLRGDKKPYRYQMIGQVATLGQGKGIADVMGIRLRGVPGWFVGRTYHLSQMPLLSRQTRVMSNWTLALLFRRDISDFTMLTKPPGLGEEDDETS